MQRRRTAELRQRVIGDHDIPVPAAQGRLQLVAIAAATVDLFDPGASALTRRFYGDRRVNQCMIRAGFKRWYEAGFPRGSEGLPPKSYFNRGRDEWVRISHDEATKIAAAALKNTIPSISTSGELRPSNFGQSW